MSITQKTVEMAEWAGIKVIHVSPTAVCTERHVNFLPFGNLEHVRELLRACLKKGLLGIVSSKLQEDYKHSDLVAIGLMAAPGNIAKAIWTTIQEEKQ